MHKIYAKTYAKTSIISITHYILSLKFNHTYFVKQIDLYFETNINLYRQFTVYIYVM